jgi:hypothetical protein
MGSTARSPRVCARVRPHRGQGDSLVPLYTRESVSLPLWMLGLLRWKGRARGALLGGDVDLKKLKKLIVSGKLAPCFPGQEGGADDHPSPSAAGDDGRGSGAGAEHEKGPCCAAAAAVAELDECPICFLQYPCLNHSRQGLTLVHYSGST